MKKWVLLGLLLNSAGLADEVAELPALPDSPLALIEALKEAGTAYTVWTPRLDYVSESDLPGLVALLDSKEPCAHVVLAISSSLPTGRSTVGHQAAYLIEGFWKRYYPTGLDSERYTPNPGAIRQWHAMWSNLRRLAESGVHPPARPAEGGADH